MLPSKRILADAGVVPSDIARAMIETSYLSRVEMSRCMDAAARALRHQGRHEAAIVCEELSDGAAVCESRQRRD